MGSRFDGRPWPFRNQPDTPATNVPPTEQLQLNPGQRQTLQDDVVDWLRSKHTALWADWLIDGKGIHIAAAWFVQQMQQFEAFRMRRLIERANAAAAELNMTVPTGLKVDDGPPLFGRAPIEKDLPL